MAAKILLTGRPGVGKTTIVNEVIRQGVPIAGGFLTEEIRQAQRRVGFRVRDVHTGDEGVLAHVQCKGRPRVGKYGVDVASFERVGVAALRSAAGRDGCVVIDEIGKMELHSRAFREVVEELIDSDRPLLCTIPAYRVPFVDRLRRHRDVTLIEAAPSNRDDLPEQLRRMLGGLKQIGPARPGTLEGGQKL